ncbi:MAG: Uma2 family endonuclease [Aggregatilineales bacterium]
MAVQTHLMVSEFERIAALAENADKRLEFIGGEIVEVVSNNFASTISARFLIRIGNFVEAHNLGYLTNAEGGYVVSGERYIPDVGFISKTRQPKPSHDTWNPLAPDLAVEVVSPTDRPQPMTDKVANYLSAGTLVWYVYPDDQQVKVYAPGQPVRTLGIDDVLDGSKVLPGLKLALRDIFSVE